MEVKGVAIKSNIDFFREKYNSYYASFLEKLDDDVRVVYEGRVDIAQWYEIKNYYLKPMQIFADVAKVEDNIEFAKSIGIYSANVTLTGIYKIFIFMATPQYVLKKASSMMKTFYKDAVGEIIESGANWCKLQISNFPDLNNMLEHRIAAFSQRALELASAKNVKYIIEFSITKGNDKSVIFFHWE